MWRFLAVALAMNGTHERVPMTKTPLPTTIQVPSPSPHVFSIVDENYDCKTLPRVCNPPAQANLQACSTLFPDCYQSSSILSLQNNSVSVDACDRIALLNDIYASQEASECLKATNLTALTLLYHLRLDRTQVHAFNKSVDCHLFVELYTNAIEKHSPCMLDNLLITSAGWLPSKNDFQSFVHYLMDFVSVWYSPQYDMTVETLARKEYQDNSFLHGGLDTILTSKMTLVLLLECIIICIALVVLCNVLTKLCRSNSYATRLYHHTLRDFAIAGFLPFLIQRCIGWNLLDQQSIVCHGLDILKDLIWFFVLSNAIQALLASIRLFAKHQRRTNMAALPLSDFLSMATGGNLIQDDNQVKSRFRSGMDYHLLRHLFLKAHSLPTQFQFDVYINHVEASSLVEIFDLSWWSWLILAGISAIVLMISNAFAHSTMPPQVFEEMEKLAAHIVRPLEVEIRVIVLSCLVVLIVIALLLLSWYLTKMAKGLLMQSSDVINQLSMNSKLASLQIVCEQEKQDVMFAGGKDSVAALMAMERLSVTLESSYNELSITSTVIANEVLTSTLVQIPTWKRQTMESVVKLCTLIPVIYAAIAWDCFLMLLSAPGWYRVSLLSVILLLLFTSVFFIPYLVGQLSTVIGVACPIRGQVQEALSSSILNLRQQALNQKSNSAATIVLSPPSRVL
ncbi:hypothetical protein THRCLA_06187 [Thraustotheca clavata]|uniref:Transmembrane protein n=1 Tax=Thraustotheca clavata TaxID=74557 RepID=A0A1V9ZQ48_9STRA|nr:hypothetical protein THRCLA_06187 [Thraustotheca clavata]